MARVSIYVPDTMKARMDAFGDTVNWSSIAQGAFEIDLSKRNPIGDDEMQAIVERIKASKIAYVEEEKARGRKEGKEWASKSADYADLRKMAGINLSEARDENAEYVNAVFGIEEKNEESWFFDDETRDWVSDEYVEAFIEAVSEIWDAVLPHL